MDRAAPGQVVATKNRSPVAHDSADLLGFLGRAAAGRGFVPTVATANWWQTFRRPCRQSSASGVLLDERRGWLPGEDTR
ncbi:MAG: hypothetical protein QOJ19_2171 [Acidimicrobiia bacterium]|nr:hypothetical protein [Acidimicrobiia bacterium]